MDAITLLKDEHRSVEKLFKRFEAAGPKAYAEKRETVERIIEALSRHAAIEEMLFYPVTRLTVPAVEDIALESLEEHHIVKWVLSELDGMDPEAERYDAKVTVLIENVRHHVEEEESDYFPKVREELGRNALGDLGDAMEEARRTAPTHPHPRSPDTPPGNLPVAAVAGAVDRARDTLTGAAEGGVAAVTALVDRIRGRKPTRQPAAAGSPTARKAARTVRTAAEGAADRVVDTTIDLRNTGQRTTAGVAKRARKAGSAAKAGAKATGSTARTATTTTRSAAKATGTTAKKAAARTRSTAKRTTTTATRGASSTVRTARTAAKKTARAASGS